LKIKENKLTRPDFSYNSTNPDSINFSTDKKENIIINKNLNIMRAFMRFTGISVAILCFVLTSYSQNKPKATYMVGKSKVSVWETEKQGEFGKFTTKNFKIEKVYKKGKEWKTTNSFNLTELLQLRAAIDKAINEEGVIVKETDNPENKKTEQKEK